MVLDIITSIIAAAIIMSPIGIGLAVAIIRDSRREKKYWERVHKARIEAMEGAKRP